MEGFIAFGSGVIQKGDRQMVQVFAFHLMPYLDLPDDFLEKYGSAWITLPNSYYDPEKGRQYYHQFFDQLEFADRLGFDGVCVNEHHQTAYGNIPSPNVMAALLARHIKNGKIAIVGNAISLHAIPQRVPKAVQIPWNLPPKTDTRFCKLLPPLKIWKGPLIAFGRRP